MKTLSIIVFVIFTSSTFLNAQQYSRAKICLNGKSFQELAVLPIALDHYHLDKNCIISDFSQFEIATATQHGFAVEIIIDDVVNHYAQQNNKKQLKGLESVPCNSDVDVLSKYPTPVNFSLGSMGGYFTYQEFLGHLDSMHSKYPNLIKQRSAIDTFLTHEGRPIYWLKISDNPNLEETQEPQVLYTALHHAREPAGLSQLIFYMYYLLENYSTDPKIKALVDSTELYFVPMINPDGYIYNQTTEPFGGGLWRKNRRNNGDGTFGVDLNRNYSYQWGGLGASSDPETDIYHGLSPFSEPETKAIKFFTESHTFKYIFNYHTFSDLLLYPFGYAENILSQDDSYFRAFTAPMVSENNYANILSSLLYPASGDSDDWMYGDTTSKPKVFAMTPEVGGGEDGFWPPAENILHLCKENIKANLILAELPHNYGLVTQQDHHVMSSQEVKVKLWIQRLGLTPGDLEVSFNAISPSILAINSAYTIQNLDLEERNLDSITILLNEPITGLDTLEFEVIIDNGMYQNKERIVLFISNYNSTPVYVDAGNSTENWTGTNWGVSTQEFYSPSSSITDSPLGNYDDGVYSTLRLNETFDLSNAHFGQVEFWAKWDIENDYDYVQFEVFSNNTWTPLCGRYTNLGSENQNFEQPLYDGTQENWVQEVIALTDYLGQSGLSFRFTLVSDEFQTGDGFYFDDFKVFVSDSTLTSVKNTPKHPTFLVYPNPTQDFITIEKPQGITSSISIEITDYLGKLVYKNTSLESKFNLNLSDISAGLYTLRIFNADYSFNQMEKIVLAK